MDAHSAHSAHATHVAQVIHTGHHAPEPTGQTDLAIADQPRAVTGEIRRLLDSAHAAPFERAVRRFFEELTRAPRFAHGHVSADEGEGVRLALAAAARRLPRAPVYLGDRPRPELLDALRTLGAELVAVRSRPDGTLDPGELYRAVEERAGRGEGAGAIVLATCGTAATGAVDDIGVLRRAASVAGRVSVHTDATLGGMVAAHAPSRPAWSFPDGADSVSVSAHRILGLPMPWCVTLSRTGLTGPPLTARRAADGPARPGASRADLSTLLVWSALWRLGRMGVTAHVVRRLETAAYAERRLREAGAEPSRAPDSLTVTLTGPHPSGGDGPFAVDCAGPVTYAAVDRLAAELEAGAARRGAVAEPAV